MEKELDVKTVLVSYVCDKCESGDMLFTGRMRPTNPGSYLHRCENCNDQNWLRKKYPSVETRPINTQNIH